MTTYEFQYRTLSEALYDSLVPDPFYFMLVRTVVGHSEQKKEALLRYLDYSIVEGHRYGRRYFPEQEDYGVSIWSKPMDEKLEKEMKDRKKEFLLTAMGQDSLDYYNTVVAFMSQQSVLLVPHEAWYLSIVGLRPSHQNRGLGATLIHPILEETDQMGLTTYLETFNPRNISFYKRFGYESVGNFNEPTVEAKYWILVRQPR